MLNIVGLYGEYAYFPRKKHGLYGGYAYFPRKKHGQYGGYAYFPRKKHGQYGGYAYFTSLNKNTLRSDPPYFVNKINLIKNP